MMRLSCVERTEHMDFRLGRQCNFFIPSLLLLHLIHIFPWFFDGKIGARGGIEALELSQCIVYEFDVRVCVDWALTIWADEKLLKAINDRLKTHCSRQVFIYCVKFGPRSSTSTEKWNGVSFIFQFNVKIHIFSIQSHISNCLFGPSNDSHSVFIHMYGENSFVNQSIYSRKREHTCKCIHRFKLYYSIETRRTQCDDRTLWKRERERNKRILSKISNEIEENDDHREKKKLSDKITFGAFEKCSFVISLASVLVKCISCWTVGST